LPGVGAGPEVEGYLNVLPLADYSSGALFSETGPWVGIGGLPLLMGRRGIETRRRRKVP